MKKYMGKLKDLTGKTFGRLTVLERHSTGSPVYWLCQCDCGEETIARGGHLKDGNVQSCGCLRRESGLKSTNLRPGANRKHSHTTRDGYRSPTYRSWDSMKSRCLYASNASYPHYGGAGITVCDRWRDSFKNFLADMGERPEGTSLGRYGDTGNYEPGNCAWMTPTEQGLEQRKKNGFA